MVRGKIKKPPNQNGDKDNFSSDPSEGPDQRSGVSLGQRPREKAVDKPCLKLHDYRISEAEPTLQGPAPH